MAQPAEDTALALTTDMARLAPALVGLPERQQRYVLARLRGFSIRTSGKLAGYVDPDSAGYHLEKNPKVRLVIDAMTKAAATQLGVERKDVIAGLMDAVQMAANSAELTAAWREVAKVIGAYEPVKVEHTHRVTHEKLQTMSDDELAALADDPAFTIEGEFEKIPKQAGAQDAQASADSPAPDDASRYGDSKLEPATPEGLSEQDTEALLAEIAYTDETEDEPTP